jgi:GH18 family chitinase
MYTNAVYWPNYRIYNGDTPGQLNYGCINRVYYAFASVTADGGVFVSQPYLDTHPYVLLIPRLSSVTSGPMPGLLVTASMARWGH